MILANNIINIEHINLILDSLKPAEQYISTLKEGSYEYENLCESVGEQLCEIDEYLVGKKKLCDKELCLCDLRMFDYWKYLKGSFSFKTLINKINKNNSKE